MIRTVLADDHTLMRAGIRALMTEMGDIAIVGEAENGREAVALAREHQPLVKDSVPLELRMAIDAAMRGDVYVSSRVSRHLVGALKGGVPGESSLDALTPRQREILQLIAEGKSTKQIAFALEVSVKTVEAHRAGLMERLGIRDVAGLVLYAVRHNLVSPDDSGR